MRFHEQKLMEIVPKSKHQMHIQSNITIYDTNWTLRLNLHFRFRCRIILIEFISVLIIMNCSAFTLQSNRKYVYVIEQLFPFCILIYSTNTWIMYSSDYCHRIPIINSPQSHWLIKKQLKCGMRAQTIYPKCSKQNLENIAFIIETINVIFILQVKKTPKMKFKHLNERNKKTTDKITKCKNNNGLISERTITAVKIECKFYKLHAFMRSHTHLNTHGEKLGDTWIMHKWTIDRISCAFQKVNFPPICGYFLCLNNN